MSSPEIEVDLIYCLGHRSEDKICLVKEIDSWISP